MNLLVLIAIVAVLVILWLVDRRVRKVHPLAWVAVWWAAIYVLLRFGIQPPLPMSILSMFMGIVTLALLVYVTADTGRMRKAWDGIAHFVTDRRYLAPLIVVVVLLPLLVAWRVYRDANRAPQPPLAGRTIHPPPPGQIVFKGKTINLTTADNPYRALEQSDPDAFAQHVADGRHVYFQNCVFCHGDNMEGKGLFAHGFDPIPADFQDPTTIAMLQESYLFWRISKGGPGLPEEATPWSSAMPAWEHFLSEDQIWDVILFLYDYTGQRPRARGNAE